MAGGGGPPGSKKRKRAAARRRKAPSKRAKGKKPYEAPAVRGGGSKEEPQPVTAMGERVAAEEMSESREPDSDLEKELKVLCVKLRYHTMSTNRRCRLVTEALRKMDGKYLEIARSPTACVLQLCVKWCSHSERDAVFVALQPHLLDLSRDKHTVFLVHNIIKMAFQDRKRIIKSLKGKIIKLALNDYGCLFVICLLSIVDNTELVTEVVIDELTKQLKELIFDKNGRHPLLQLFHPLCSRYLTLGELFYLNYNVPSLVSKVNFGSKLDDVADKEHGGSQDTMIASDSKEDPIKRRQELLVKSELYEVLIETCIENVGKLLRTNFGKDVLYEVAVGGKNNFLERFTDRIHILHNAIACDAARPRTDDGDEHAFDNYHSSRTIRRMILDCPAFAATLWKTALEGKCKLYADGFSSMVVAAYLESPDSMVKDLAKSELQPLIDGGILKPQEHKAEEEKSAMECSSDESSELSDTDTGYYAKKAYRDLKSGKLVARFGTDRFRCPFCPEKKKLDYCYRDLIQHVIVVGASRRPWKVRANHQVLANYLETDHADAAASSSMPLRQAEALYLSKVKRRQAGPRSTCKPSR